MAAAVGSVVLAGLAPAVPAVAAGTPAPETGTGHAAAAADTGQRSGSPDAGLGSGGTVVLPDVVDEGRPAGPRLVPVAVSAAPGTGGGVLVVAAQHLLARTAAGAAAGWFGWADRYAGLPRVPGQRLVGVDAAQAPGRQVLARMPDGGAVVLAAVNGTDAAGSDQAVLYGRAVRADGSPRPGWTGVSVQSPGDVAWRYPRPGRMAVFAALALPDGRVRACAAVTPLPPGGGPVQAWVAGWTAAGVATVAGDWRGAPAVRLVGLAGCEGLAADGAGRLLAAGPSASGRVGVVRTSAAGAVDAGWGVDGLVVLPAGVRLVPGRLVATARGTVYVGVSARTAGGRWAAGVAKLTAAGVLDASFGAGGVALLPDPRGSSRLDALTTAPGGTLLVAATTASATGARRHVLARVWAATGRLDRGFAARGVAVLPLLPVDAWTTTAGGRATLTLAGNTATWRAGTWVPLRAVLHRRVL